jgi:hypothetical protein
MPGGLINIVSNGNTDLYLTASPQITFFKSVYRRHTNFAREPINIPISDLNFNNISEIIIPRIGDLVHKLYLEIDLPEVLITKNDADISINHNKEHNKLKQIQKAIILENKIIDEFIQLNIEAYIAGMNDIEAINVVDPKEIIETILDVFISHDQLCGDYNKILKINGLNLNLSNINNKMKQLIKNSQINLFAKHNQLSITRTERNDESQKLIQIIKNELNYSIDECKKIKIYFNDKLINITKKIEELQSPFIKFAWKKNLGHLMIEWIEIYIGNELIDKHYSEWFDIVGELFQDNKYHDEMIGNCDILTLFDYNLKPKYKLIIPLHFWFCKLTGLAFPLVALQHNDLKLRIKIKSITDCCSIATDETPMDIIWNNKNLTLQGNLIVEYIYLDNEERKKFAHSAHEYLIETVEMNEIKNVDKNEIKCELNFKGPTKEIIWVVESSTKDPFNYIPIKSAKFTFGDLPIMDFNSSKFFNYLTSYKYHSKIPKEGVNIISFALRPEEHQPSGSTNLSVISNLILHIILPESDNIDYTIKVFTVRYNILRFLKGYAALAYS